MAVSEPGPRRVRDLPLALGETDAQLLTLAAQALGVPKAAITQLRRVKVSLDARARPPKRIVSVDVWLEGDAVMEAPVLAHTYPVGLRPPIPGTMPIIVGTGPAGLWAALGLLERGIPSVLLDRGGPVETRNRAVRDLRVEGALDPESNLCFGEGGAGTYSDGKLYTRIKDGRVRRVYEDLVAFGAPAEILVAAHPHVGTNGLIKLLRTIRGHLEGGGCDLRFGAKMVDLLIKSDGAVGGVRLEDGTEIDGPAVILATGHSARDTLAMLHGHGATMTRKAFAMGARVEHPQELIDTIQYGAWCEHPDLDPARYALTARVSGRGVYSFCMCPGGFVIPTSTEPGHLNVNGMSNSNRGSRWANSALVVTVEPDDFYLERPGDLDAHGPLAGIALQRALEQATFAAGGGGYRAPASRLTDFLDRRTGDLPPKSSYRPGLTAADLHDLLPRRIADPISRAVHHFERKMPGFLTEESVLIATETTTSSPLRIQRDDSLASPDLPGLYPTGEGAGFAGGIVSSAIDGLKVAESVANRVSEHGS
jgi:uncharacterized FAD-dependent dehydrogenase